MPSADATILNEISAKLERQLTKQEVADAAMYAHIADDHKNFDSLFARLGRVENKIAWFTGGLAALLVVTNIVLAILQVINLK